MPSPYRVAGSKTTSPWTAGRTPPWTVRQPSPLLSSAPPGPPPGPTVTAGREPPVTVPCAVPEVAVEPASPEGSPLPTHVTVERRPSEEISQLFAGSAGHSDGDKVGGTGR